ncbi:uncharacterized protein LOC144715554 [Wolffia australiana]
MLDVLKHHLQNSQAQMKRSADKHRHEVTFKAGDMVYIKLRPYRVQSLARRPNEKLGPRYFGPYRICQRIGPVAYKLELPTHCLLHPVFHVSQLRQAVGLDVASSEIPPVLTKDLVWNVSLQALKDYRYTGDGTQVLIEFQQLPDFEATWEDAARIADRFPEFQLEDKLILQGGRIVKTPTQKYQRQQGAKRPPVFSAHKKGPEQA